MTLRLCHSVAKLLPKDSTARCMSFKSGLSLDKIYPNSVDVKPFQPPVSENGKFTGYIPVKELDVTYSRSSGPGGQHVHKNNTKVDLRFNVAKATWICEDTKQKLLTKYATRINKDGYFIIRSEKTRSQLLNLADAMTYLREIIYKLEDPQPTPKPETEELIRKRMEKAARIRLMEKRMHSLKKAQRRDPEL